MQPSSSGIEVVPEQRLVQVLGTLVLLPGRQQLSLERGKGSSLNKRIGRKESWRREERNDRLRLSG
jgi:hypothetical protein